MGTAVLTHGRRSPCAALVRSLVVMLACAACSLRTVHSQGVSPATLESRSPAEATPPPVSVSHIFMSPNVIVLPPASPGSLPLPELPGFNAPLANTNGVPQSPPTAPASPQLQSPPTPPASPAALPIPTLPGFNAPLSPASTGVPQSPPAAPTSPQLQSLQTPSATAAALPVPTLPGFNAPLSPASTGVPQSPPAAPALPQLQPPPTPSASPAALPIPTLPVFNAPLSPAVTGAGSSVSPNSPASPGSASPSPGAVPSGPQSSSSPVTNPNSPIASASPPPGSPPLQAVSPSPATATPQSTATPAAVPSSPATPAAEPPPSPASSKTPAAVPSPPGPPASPQGSLVSPAATPAATPSATPAATSVVVSPPSPRSIFPPASPSPSATIPPSPPNSPTSPASPAPPAIQSPSGEAPPPQNPVSSLSTDTNSPSLLVVASPASPAAAPPSPAQQLPVQSPLPTPLSPQSVISDRAAPGPFTGLEVPGLAPAPFEAPAVAPAPVEVPGLAPAPVETAELAPAPNETPELAPTPAEGPEVAPTPAEVPEVAPEVAPTPAEVPEVAPTPAEVPEVAPTPAEVPGVAPTPAEVPEVAPIPAAALTVSPPAAAPFQPVVVPFGAGNIAGAPSVSTASIPTTGANITLQVTGATLDTFASQFEQPWNGVLAGIAGVDPSWSKVMQVSSPSAMGGRRRLLQVANTAPLTISTFVASTDPNSAYRALVGSISDTSEKGLASQLRGIGLNLIPESINIQTNPPQPGAFVNPAGSAVPPPASPPAAPPAGDSNRNLILAIVLPVVLGGLLALLVVCLIIFCRRRNRGGNSSLRKPFHSRNPMYDSNVTTTSSSRGEDWEVLPVPPERRSDASPRQRSQPGNPFAEGASAFSDEDMSPPISPERPSTSRSKGDLSRSGSDYRASITLGAAAGTAGAAAVAAGLHSARSGRYDTTGSFTSVHSRGGASTNTFVTAPTTLAGHSSIQDFHDALSHAPGSIRSDSFASARSGAVRSAAGPDMFDVIARDDSFEYAPSGGEAAPSQGAQEADNPLFGGDILDTNNSLTGGGGQRNPMFDSQPGQVMRSVQAHPIRVSSDFGTVRSGSGGYSPVSDDDGARNPLYASRHSDIPDEAGEDRNPLYDSHAQMPGGAEDNPMFGTGSDLMDTRDSMGGDRNPLFDSRGNRAITPSGAAANPLFGSDILDTRDSMGGDRNPLWESSENVARQPGGPPAQRIGPPAQRSAGRVL